MAKPKPDPKIAERLKGARERLFKTASEAAEALGINAVTLRTHEAGTRGISYGDLMTYARRYGVALDWILTGKGEPGDVGQAEAFVPDTFPIMAVAQDGAWLPDDNDHEYPGWAEQQTPGGIVELVSYSDPRFPPEMIDAIRVRTQLQNGAYPDGAIVFVIPSWEVGYREGDHVIVVRLRGGFGEWTLRQVSKSKDDRVEFRALISDEPPFSWVSDPKGLEGETHIVGVVVGALIRRPVPALSLGSRSEYRTAQRRMRKYDVT